MRYAIILTGNKQYKVSEGDIIEIDQLSINQKNSYTFSNVLLFSDRNSRRIGKPYLSDVRVMGQVLENKKGPKIRVAKFKAKTRYRRIKGFRPSVTRVKIEKISQI